jgi:hypothetical protein
VSHTCHSRCQSKSSKRYVWANGAGCGRKTSEGRGKSVVCSLKVGRRLCVVLQEAKRLVTTALYHYAWYLTAVGFSVTLPERRIDRQTDGHSGTKLP